MAQTVSELWTQLWNTSNTKREYAFDINGVWYELDDNAEVEHNVESSLYSDFGIGNAAAATLSLGLFADNIPRAAKIKRFIRLVNGDQVSEWLPKGVFFANTRANDDGYWTVEAVDAMRKADAIWEPDQSLVFPMPMTEAVEIIAALMGVEIDPRTNLNPAYTIDYPVSKQTLRKTLAWISAAHGGNFRMTDEGKLLLVPLISAPAETNYLVTETGAPIVIGGMKILVDDAASGLGNADGSKFYVGLDITSFSNNGKYKPVSRVTLLLDDENAVTAGDDTGFEIVADCPYATQTMVDALLAALKGYEYQAYEAEEANIDPAAELGDGVTVNGIYSVIAKISDDGEGYPSLAAPGEAELEGDLLPGGPMTQEFDRKIAETYSLITKTAEQIRQEVVGVEEAISYIEIDLEAITNRVQDAEGNIGMLELTATQLRSEISGKIDGDYAQTLIDQSLDTIELAVSSKNGSTTFTLTGGGAELSAQTLKLSVDAVNITGTLTIGQLPSDVATEDQIPIYTSELINNSGYQTYDGVTTITSNMIATASIRANQITTGTLSAAALSLDGLLGLTYYGSTYGYVGVNASKGGPVICDSGMNIFFVTTNNAAKMSYYEEKMIWVASGGCYSSETMKVYSDKRLKNTISYDLTEEEQIFASLKPCSFRMNNDRARKKHWGFIAQDVVDGIEGMELDADELAVVGSSNGLYSIGYGEFTALNTYMIQKLMARVAELEARL